MESSAPARCFLFFFLSVFLPPCPRCLCGSFFFGSRSVCMLRFLGLTLATWLLLTSFALAGDAKYTIKPAQSLPPPAISEPIRKLLDDKSTQLLGENGAVICEIWFSKELPVKAAPAQIQNGLTYREL